MEDLERSFIQEYPTPKKWELLMENLEKLHPRITPPFGTSHGGLINFIQEYPPPKIGTSDLGLRSSIQEYLHPKK